MNDLENLKGLRVASDGTIHGTKIFDRDGRELTAELRVRKVIFTHEAGDVPRITLEVFPSVVEVTTLANVAVTHVTGRPRHE